MPNTDKLRWVINPDNSIYIWRNGGEILENSLDNLTGKISAQDIITANSQAEARESERIRLEAEEYKKQLDEIRNNDREHRESISSISKRLEDSDNKVHDVGVQVYRNVQAVIEDSQQKSRDQNRAAFNEIDKKLDAVQDTVASSTSGAVVPLLVITMLIAGADLVINILRILGIL